MTNNRYFYIVLLGLVNLAIFCQVIGHEFVLYDDNRLIYENPRMQSLTLPNISHFWKNPDFGNLYEPLSLTIFAIEAAFAKTTPSVSDRIGFNPAIFHTTNLLLHVLSAILVFLILRILIKDELACFFGALLFAIHPVQVESFAWVSNLKDVLSGFFSLVAIWQYLLYVKLSMASLKGDVTNQDRADKNPDRNKIKTLHYLIAVISFMLALLAKPTRVIVPIVAFILDYFILKRRFRDIVISLSGFMAITLPMIAVTIYFQYSGSELPFSLSFLERLLIASDSLVFYLYKLILPISLGPDYGRTPQFVLSQNFIYFAWIIPLVLLIVICIIKKHRSWLLASAGIFIAGVLPVLGFMQFGFQEISTVADRYLYLSMLGPGLALAFFLSSDMFSLNKKRLIIGMCGAMLVLLGILSIIQTRYWENTVTFSKHALQVNPRSNAFHINLGIALAQQGNDDEAVQHYSEALRLSSNNVEAHINWGIVLEKQGKLDEAVLHYSEALRLSPDSTAAHTKLGIVLAQQGNVYEAVFHFSEALRISPDNLQAHTYLGFVLAQQGKYDEAVYHLLEALKSNPNNLLARSNLGFSLAQQGKYDEAVVNFNEALKLSPTDAGAHTNLGIVLAQQGIIDEAIFHFSEALKTDPGNQEAYVNLIKAQSLKK